MASVSPTQRTLAELRKRGYTAQVVERWNPFARRRIDLFGCIDIVAIGLGYVLGVQTTSDANHAARMTKAREEPRLTLWLEDGAVFEVWSWGLKGKAGKRKLWTLRRTGLALVGGRLVEEPYD